MHRTTHPGIARSLLLTAVAAASFAASRDADARPFPGTLLQQPTSSSGVHPFPGDTATQCGVITYCGGPVLSNVQTVPVFWTSGVSSQITSWAPGYLKSVVNSELIDMLSQYSTAGKTGEACGMQTDAGLQYFGPPKAFSTGQTITRGTATSAYTITPTVTTGTTIADDNAAIGTELVAQIKAGKLPAPTYDKQGYPNTIYFVFFPSSYSITLQGMGSCSAFGGYHYSVAYTGEPSCKGQYIPYAVIPSCGGDPTTVSHELAEAITDTDVGPTTPMTGNYGDGAWYLGPTNPCSNDPTPGACPSNCGEVGDVCQNAGSETIPGTTITSQDIWSQMESGSAGGCVVSNASIGTKPAPTGTPITSCMAPPPPPPDAGTGSKDAGGASSGGEADSGSGSGSGGGSGSSSGSGSGSGGGEEAGVGPEQDASPGSSSSSGGGNSLDNNGTSSSGCSCTMMPADASGGASALGALLGLALLARARGRRGSR